MGDMLGLHRSSQSETCYGHFRDIEPRAELTGTSEDTHRTHTTTEATVNTFRKNFSFKSESAPLDEKLQVTDRQNTLHFDIRNADRRTNTPAERHIDTRWDTRGRHAFISHSTHVKYVGFEDPKNFAKPRVSNQSTIISKDVEVGPAH